MNGKAILRNGRLVTIVREDTPPGWTPPEGCTVIPADELPPDIQREPDPDPAPHADTLAGLPVTRIGDTVTLTGRLRLSGADLETTSPDSGVIFHDEQGRGWLLTVDAGAPIIAQVSASPEVNKPERLARLATRRQRVQAAKAARDAEGKTATLAKRVAVLEALLGVELPA